MNGKALLAGAGANAAGYAVTAAGVLVGIGALSRFLTPEQFGAYFLLMMLPSILGSFDFGLNVQVTRSVARWRTGEAPIEEVNAVQTAYLTLGGAIFLVGAVVIVLFTEPINSLLSLGDAGPGRLYWLLALIYATLAFTSVSLVAALKGDGRFGTSSVVISTASLTFAASMVALNLVPVERPLLAAVGVHATIGALQFVALVVIVRRRIPVTPVTVAGVLRYRRDLLHFGRNVIGAKLLAAFITNAMKALSAAMYGPVAAGYVGVGLAAGNKYHTLVFALSEVLLPHFSSRESGDPRWVRRALVVPGALVLGFSGLLFAIFALFGQPLVTLWLGETGAGAFPIIRAIVLGVVIQAPLPFYYHYVMAIGRPEIHLRQVVIIAASWLLSFVVLHQVVAGVDAIAYAYVLAFFVGLLVYTLTIRNLLTVRESLREAVP